MPSCHLLCISGILLVSVAPSRLVHGDDPVPEPATNICLEPVCKYEFVIRRSRTMTFVDKVTNLRYNVRLNGTRLQVTGNSYKHSDDPLSSARIGSFVEPRDVITADGFPRNIFTINDEFPGPTIEVLEGSTVEVRVVNRLWTESVSLHWHGMAMADNLWMDGVPMVTQCAVPPGAVFTYRFRSEPSGTHWYHSHLHSQRLDGLAGVIIVHPKPHPPDTHIRPATTLIQPLPPIQIPVFLQDWLHEESLTLETTDPYDPWHPGTGELHLHDLDRLRSQDGVELSALKYVSGLIQGRGSGIKAQGQGQGHGQGQGQGRSPLATFSFHPGRRHRLRMVNAGAEHTFEVSIDGHQMAIVASDGHELRPIPVDSVIIFPGERIDVEVTANQVPGKYWLRSAILARNEADAEPLSEVLAYVRYATAAVTTGDEPVTSRKMCSDFNPCRIFNCPFPEYPVGRFKSCIHLNDLVSAFGASELQEEYGLNDIVDEEIFLNFAFSFGSSINGRKFVPLLEPLFQNNPKSAAQSCNVPQCREQGCICTHIRRLPYNKTVQLVLSNLQPGFPHVAHHVVHLHGYKMAVVKAGFPTVNRTSGRWLRPNRDIRCNNAICTNPAWRGRPNSQGHLQGHDLHGFNLHNPPVKDTVVIPARGYMVVRFRTRNPGWWLLHCHQELHLMEGMAMILEVGDPEGFPAVPRGFPTCRNFEPDSDDAAKRAITDSEYQEFGNQDIYPNTEARRWTGKETAILILGGLLTSVIFAFLCSCHLIGYRFESGFPLYYRTTHRRRHRYRCVSQSDQPEEEHLSATSSRTCQTSATRAEMEVTSQFKPVTSRQVDTLALRRRFGRTRTCTL